MDCPDGDPLKGEGETPGSVLVAEDDEAVRQSLRLLLEPRFRVFVADSGEQAFEIVRREAPHIVILDLEMRGLGGVETLVGIRDLNPSAHVIVLTGAGPRAVEILQLRALDYVTKPVDERRVVEIVERAEKTRLSERQDETEEDPAEVAGRIAEELGELDSGMEEDDYPRGGRLKLDYARLLASAVRDRIDPDPQARIEALIAALQDLQATFSQPGFHGRVVLEGLQALRRYLQKQASPSYRR